MPKFAKLPKWPDSDPAKDPSHPKSILPPRNAGEIYGRLWRAYGLTKANRLFGIIMAANDPKWGQVIHDARTSQALYADLQALKAVHLAPEDLKPGEMLSWLKGWFNFGVEAGALTSEAIEKIKNANVEDNAEKALE